MYTLKEAWIKMHGAEPLQQWDGKIYCNETDAAITFRANETHGYMAAYTFTLVTAGKLTIIYNDQKLTLQPDDIYMYSPGLPVTIVSASPDYHGICLLADEHVTIESPTVHDLVHIAYAPIVQLHEPKIAMQHDDALRLADKMLEIRDYLHSNHIYKEEILRMLYAVFLLDLQNAQEKAIPQRNVPQRVEEIFIGFIRLLPLHFAEHHNIAFYASQLNISVVYLSRVVRRVAGRTVVDYINQMLLMEASFLLRTSKRSISQIADQLHFADTPSFSKFFSRMKGMSPREYRETKGSNKRTQATTKQLMDTKLIIFDFDGTLGDTRRTIVTTMQMTIAELGLPRRNDQACASTIGLPLADCFKTLFPQLNDERITLCASTYRRLFEENRLTIKPQAFPHVQQTLSALKKQGFILTIASSRSHASLTELIHDLNIADYISLLIGANDVEQAKPNPEPVLKTFAATGIEASQTLVVGDMNVDILMGANAGAKTCGVTYGNGTREELAKAGAEHIIDSIDQLIPLLTV